MRGIDTQVRKDRRRIFKEVSLLAFESDNLKDDIEALPYKIVDYDIPSDYDFAFPEPLFIKTRLGDILEENVDEKYTISDSLWEGHQRRKKEHKEKGNGFGYSLFNSESEYANTISARYYKDGSEILIEQENRNPRKLTPRECARLQGFPEQFIIPVSDTQAYKQFGNSVAVPVVRAVAGQIYKAMNELPVRNAVEKK